MFFRHLKNVLPRQNNSKAKLRCPEDVLPRLGKVGLDPTFLLRNKSLTNENSSKMLLRTKKFASEEPA